MKNQNSFEISQTPAENHRVRYGVRLELYFTLKLDRGVRVGSLSMWLEYLCGRFNICLIHCSHRIYED